MRHGGKEGRINLNRSRKSNVTGSPDMKQKLSLITDGDNNKPGSFNAGRRCKSRLCQRYINTIDDIMYLLQSINLYALNCSGDFSHLSCRHTLQDYDISMARKIDMEKKLMQWLGRLEEEEISCSFVLDFLLGWESFTDTDRRIGRRKGYTSRTIKTALNLYETIN